MPLSLAVGPARVRHALRGTLAAARMRIANATPCPHLAFERATPADETLMVLVLQGTFAIDDERPLRPLPAQPPVQLADVFRGDPRTTSLRRESALATLKLRSDVHLDAVARAPGGDARADWPVRIQVGDVRKDLRVVGPRWWEHRDGGWQLGAPEPCAEVPLAWERAFGGAYTIDDRRVAEERNPLGTGFLPDGVPTAQPIAAPQVLAPDEPEHRPGERYTPQGCAPLGRDTEWRLAHAGTYDEAWRRERWPRLPDDFDYRFYTSAHPDLVVDGFLRGDERVELVNLTPSGRLVTALPGARYEAIVHRADGPVGRVPLRLDTLHLDVASADPAEHRATLTWRACLDVATGLSRIAVRRAQG